MGIELNRAIKDHDGNTTDIIAAPFLVATHPFDLLVGAAGTVISYAVVYIKRKNAKKWRKGAEYGSARWGAYY